MYQETATKIDELKKEFKANVVQNLSHKIITAIPIVNLINELLHVECAA